MNRRTLTYTLFTTAGLLTALALGMPHRRAVAQPQPPAPPPVAEPPIAQPPPPVAEQAPVQQKPTVRPKVEVVFALDTTGSMSGLIEGAKRKIWSIADFLASGQPQPEVRIGLVAYRDLGDDYVTRFYDLSDDVDTVFAHLSSFRADGGGDTPEHVARALHDAVERTHWSEGDNVVKLVYLVGDAPPHTDYHDGYDYAAIARKAARMGIHVNTIRCGNDPSTAVAWDRIARLGDGDFSTIHQSGGVATVATPFDARMAELNRKLASTAIGYGVHRGEVAAKAAAAAAAPAAIAADRASFAAKKKIAVSGDGDLLSDVEDGRAAIGHLAPTELPTEMRGMTPAQQKQFLDEKRAERDRISAEITRLAGERAQFLKSEAKAKPHASAFDDEVRHSVAKESAGAVAY